MMRAINIVLIVTIALQTVGCSHLATRGSRERGHRG